MKTSASSAFIRPIKEEIFSLACTDRWTGAGSAAYAMGEMRGWRTGLEHRPHQAKGFYGIIGIAILQRSL